MNQINFEKDQEEVLDRTENLKSLADQVKNLRNLEDQVKADEELLKNKKRDIEKISGEIIPTLLSEMGLSSLKLADASLKLADGSAVEVKPYYAASILNKNKDAAYSWLRDNGLGDIIKNNVTVSFGRNEDNKAAEYANLAKSQGYQPTQKLKVEPMTLKALVRERIEKGVEMPMDIFNVFVGNRTKLTRKQ